MNNTDIDKIEFSNLFQVIDAYCTEFQNLYKQKLERDGKRSSGALIDNMETNIEVGGTTINVTISLADYYYYVENGRQPGKFPPVDKIIKWIEQKPIIPRTDDNGKLPTTKSLAYMIGRKIANEGIKPGHELSDTIQELNKKYLVLLNTALQADFNEYYVMKILNPITTKLSECF